MPEHRWHFPVAALLATALSLAAQSPLEEGFRNPPNAARPRVYWYWQNGNITKEGLTKDLEWMHRAGIAGVETFDVAVFCPTVVNPRLLYMQPAWKDAFHHAVQLADRLGIGTTIGAAPGWSQTGGPWVKPADAMKKLVWSETAVAGGRRFRGTLPKPPDVNGPFQDQLQAVHPGWPLTRLYKDQAVLAYRRPVSRMAIGQMHPAVTSSGGQFTYADLTTRGFENPVELPASTGKASWIQISFNSPQTVRGVTVATRNTAQPTAPLETLEVSNDGVNFTRIIDLPDSVLYQRTFAFAPVTARYFRYRLPAVKPEPFRICRFQLHTSTPVNRFEAKAGFTTVPNYYEVATPQADESNSVKKSDVIDLTGRMSPGGTLDWTAPAGDWVVLRFGYSLTGQANSPASVEATGFEVDKLNKRAAKAFMDEYLRLYEDASGGLIGQRGILSVATDSWEAGLQNWTDGILADFKRLRGYDPTPWLPALTGTVVESGEASDRFLWDFRRTIADLVITSNFEQVRDSLHERGLKYITEGMAGTRVTLGDPMEMKARADYPMGEYWLPTSDNLVPNYLADVRDTASVAHIYGKQFATAESITSTGVPYSYAPWHIKPVADEEFLDGINQFTLHVTVHQPNDNAPGLGLGRYGMWFNRLETWAEQARAWTDYIARSSYLLQQGRAVIDVAYFYGEEGPATTINQAHVPEIVDGYRYDFVNRESLVNEFSVADGKLVTRAGMKYQVLYLAGTSGRMTLPVLEKIRALVKAGAVVVGLPPADSPSMSGDQAQWTAARRELWPDTSLVRTVGLGKVYRTTNLGYALGAQNTAPDFTYVVPFADVILKFYHRVDGDTDIYFVNNRSDRPVATTADFRVTGREAEIWSADRGTIRPASYRIHDGVTTVPLQLEPRDAVFIVFRHPAKAQSRTVPVPSRIKLLDVGGPWNVDFQPGRGAPKTTVFEALSDWSNHGNPGIRYFSGTATYTKKIDIPQSAMREGTRFELSLGTVHEVAEVWVNGEPAGIAWKPPYRVDITHAVKSGENALTIKVVNLWPNRLIGDQQPGAEKFTFAPISKYTANSPLLPSGLLGPVIVEQLVTID